MYRSVEQNRKNRNIHTQKYLQLIFDESVQAIQWEKNNLLNKWCRGNWISICTQMHNNYSLIPYSKINANVPVGVNINSHELPVEIQNSIVHRMFVGQRIKNKT